MTGPGYENEAKVLILYDIWCWASCPRHVVESCHHGVHCYPGFISHRLCFCLLLDTFRLCRLDLLPLSLCGHIVCRFLRCGNCSNNNVLCCFVRCGNCIILVFLARRSGALPCAPPRAACIDAWLSPSGCSVAAGGYSCLGIAAANLFQSMQKRLATSRPQCS